MTLAILAALARAVPNQEATRWHRRSVPDEQRRDRRASQAGQSLVEFSLVIPLFLVVLMAVIEFSFLMNGQLSINYATRDAALIAAEAGNAGLDAQNDDLADCVILQKVQQDVTAPASTSNITQVQIYWTNATGQPLDTSGNVTTFGSANQAVDLYVPGSTTCTFPGLDDDHRTLLGDDRQLPEQQPLQRHPGHRGWLSHGSLGPRHDRRPGHLLRFAGARHCTT